MESQWIAMINQKHEHAIRFTEAVMDQFNHDPILRGLPTNGLLAGLMTTIHSCYMDNENTELMFTIFFENGEDYFLDDNGNFIGDLSYDDFKDTCMEVFEQAKINILAGPSI